MISRLTDKLQQEDIEVNNNYDESTNTTSDPLPIGSDLSMHGSDISVHANEGLIMNGGVVGVGWQSTSLSEQENHQQTKQEQLQEQQSEKNLMDAKIEQNKAIMAVIKDNKIKEKLEKDFAEENISEDELEDGLQAIHVHQSNLKASQDLVKKADQKNAWGKKK